MTTAHLGFKPTQRLRAAADIERARKSGGRAGDNCFGIHYVANGRDHARLGTAVGVRVAGSASERNRIRRVIRESFRLHQHELPRADVFVTARSGARAAQNSELFASLGRLWKKVRES